MIAIVNVSSEDAPNTGINQYEVRINRKVIAKFAHERKIDGLSQCLRDAADAVDAQIASDRRRTREQIELINELMERK